MQRTFAALAAAVTLSLTGCLSGGESDASRRWDIPDTATAPSTVRTRVQLPSILRQPSLVTYSQAGPKVHDLDRWGTPLEEAIQLQLSALLRNAPVQDVSVQVQRLTVSTTGRLQLDFSTRFNLLTGSNDLVTALRSSGCVIDDDKPREGASLAVAVATYGQVPAALAKSILESVAQEQGRAAKLPAKAADPSK